MHKYLLVILLLGFAASCGREGSVRNNLLPVKYGNTYGYIDRSGKVVVPLVYRRVGCYEGGVAVVADTNGNWGYIDNAGKFVTKPVYSYAATYSEGVAWVVPHNGCPTLIDKNGVQQLVLPDAQSAEMYSEGMAAYSTLTEDGELWGFVDKKGKVVLPPQYSAVSYFSDGLCAVMNSSGKWGYVDKKGDLKIPYLFDNANPFVGGKAKVAAGGKYGVIDKKGSYLLSPKYEDLDIDGDQYLVKNKGLWGWINVDKEEVIPTQFTDAYPFRGNKMAAAKNGGKWGYINTKGKFVIAPQYDFAFGYDGDRALVEMNGKYGFIDPLGNYVIDPIYDHVPVDYYIRYFAQTSAFYNVKTDVNEPRSIAYKWLTGFYHLDYDEARKYATTDTRAMIDEIAALSGYIVDSARRQMLGLTVGIKSCQQNGHRAIVTYTLSDNKSQDQLLFLTDSSGQWKVQFRKEDK